MNVQTMLGYAFGVLIVTVCLVCLYALCLDIKKRSELIKDNKQRLIDARRQAMFGNWETALTKMRIAARECPVSLDKLELDEDVISFLRSVATRHMHKLDGRNYYV